MKKILFILLLMPVFSMAQNEHPLCLYNINGRAQLFWFIPETQYIDSLLHHGGIPVRGVTANTCTCTYYPVIKTNTDTIKNYYALQKIKVDTTNARLLRLIH